MELSGSYIVYRHTFPNGKVYIGITKQRPNARWGAKGQGYKECPRMANAISKYGWDNVIHEILFEGLKKEDAEKIEIELIGAHHSNEEKYGYNIANGGNCSGTHSVETRRLISEHNKGKKKPPCTDENKKKYSLMYSGEGNPFYGKHHSNETKDKISKSRIGNDWAKRKPVVQYDFDGSIVSEYQTITEAHKVTGISMASLSYACSGKYTKAGGYVWKYKEAIYGN